MALKTYKFRIYPNKTQQQQLAIEFGHARFVWNWALDMRSKAYKRRKASMNYVAISKLLTGIKKSTKFQWLKDATAGCHTQKLIDQDKAFKAFFSGVAKYPKFKSKRYKQSVRYQLDQRQVMKNYMPGKLLKITKLGSLNIKWSQVPAGIPKMATISLNRAGQYHVALSVEENIKRFSICPRVVGLDRGIKDVFVTDGGYAIGSPKHTGAYALKLAKAQRKLARQVKGSNRRARQRTKVARIHNKITNSRRDFIHKESTKLIRDNQVIVMEDLNVTGMMKSRKLSKHIADVAWHELQRQLIYKAEWYGREVHLIDQWFPSSKLCSNCGHKHESLKLSDRQWTCPKCGGIHHRDINAAKNLIKAYRGEHGNIRTRRVA